MSTLSNIYTGVWTNYNRGSVVGRTLTLTDAGATALVSFLAVLITHTGSRSFKIVRYSIHQLRRHEEARDGFARQQDLLLANGETDMGTLGILVRIAWKWRHVEGARSFWRSLPLVAVVFVHTVLWLTAGIASSFVADGRDALVRVKGEQCGAWALAEDSRTLAAVREFQAQTMETLKSAQAYVRLCYDAAESPERAECRVLPESVITSTETHNTTCPWPGMCLEGDTSAFTIDTGLQSSAVFGINSPSPLNWQHTLTCAPLVTAPYVELRRSSGEFGEDVHHWNYGPVGLLRTNTTHWVSEYDAASAGIRLNVQTSTPWIGNDTLRLKPIPSLARPDGDLTLLFIGTPGMRFYQPIDDPIFSAHRRLMNFSMPGYESFPGYEADNRATVLGCFEQLRLCNPRSGICSPWESANPTMLETWEHDPEQRAVESKAEEKVAVLLKMHLMRTSIYVIGIVLGPSALAINDLIFGGSGSDLAREQWKTEMKHMFNLGMAATQLEVVRTARVSYPHPRGNLTNLLPEETWDICRMIMFPEQGFTSVSVLGLSIILGVSVILTVISFGEDKAGKWLVNRWYPYRVKKWTEDGLFQLHRILCEERGWGTWSRLDEEVPVTKKGERVGSLKSDNVNEDDSERRNRLEGMVVMVEGSKSPKL